MARYIVADRNQLVMLPTSIEQLVEDDHLAKNIWQIVDSLDLSAFNTDYKNDENGAEAINPKYLIAILFYAYAKGIRSSRVIEHECKYNLAFMYLAVMQTPDHSTIAAFRTKHYSALEEVFSQTIFLGLETGLIGLNHIANDGTKMDSAGSKSQFIEGKNIDSKLEKCQEMAVEILEEASKVDDIKEKTRLENKKKKLNLKIKNLEKAKKKYDLEKDKIEDKKKKLRYHRTEEDARLMKDKDGYHSGYNCQASVDDRGQFIAGKRVSQSENDRHEGEKTREDLINRFGKDRLNGTTMSFDNGYDNQELIVLDGKDGVEILISQTEEGKQNSSKENEALSFKYTREKDVFICPAGKELTFVKEKRLSGKRVYREYRINRCGSCELQGGCFKEKTKNKRQKSKLIENNKLELRETYEEYKEKMKKEEVKKEYRKRMATVEPVFGHMTSHRKASRFMVWGLENVKSEYTLMCIVHNLLKLINYGKLEQVKKLA